jgi:hypothetical protein
VIALKPQGHGWIIAKWEKIMKIKKLSLKLVDVKDVSAGGGSNSGVTRLYW